MKLLFAQVFRSRWVLIRGVEDIEVFDFHVYINLLTLRIVRGNYFLFARSGLIFPVPRIPRRSNLLV